jgi:hypothetical protein
MRSVYVTLKTRKGGATERADMKAATFVFLLLACAAVTRAQNSAAPSGDVTIGVFQGEPEYCLGPLPGAIGGTGRPRGPDDITLRLPLKLWYENHRSETIILPLESRRLLRMTVDGQNGGTILRDSRLGLDATAVMAMSRPDAPNSPFRILPASKPQTSTALDWLKCVPQNAPDCFLDGGLIPVLERFSGLDLRGKTIRIVTTRDHRSLPPEVVEKLNEKWKDYGTVWTGVVESETLTFRIPEEPLTRNCMAPLPK